MTQAVHAVRSEVEHVDVVDAVPDGPVRLRLGESDVYVDVDRLAEFVEAGGVATGDGVERINARASEDLPDWQQIEGDWWEADDDLTRVERKRMTQLEKEVWRSVEVHGLRPRDLAEDLDVEESTIRPLLKRARSKRGGAR